MKQDQNFLKISTLELLLFMMEIIFLVTKLSASRSPLSSKQITTKFPDYFMGNDAQFPMFACFRC